MNDARLEASTWPLGVSVVAMLERLRNPRLPPRDLLLDFQLVVRDSSGSRPR